MDMNYLTVKEFAKITRLSPITIRRSIEKGNIYAIRPSPGIKAPYRIPESELERLQYKSMCETKK